LDQNPSETRIGMKCPHCYRDLRKTTGNCPGCGHPLNGGLASDMVGPPPGLAKMFLQIFFAPWLFYTHFRSRNLKRIHYIALGFFVFLGFFATILWWGLIPIRGREFTAASIIAPLASLLISAFILSLILRILQFYFGESIGIFRGFCALLIMFSAFYILQLLMVWPKMTVSNPFRFIIAPWSNTFKDTLISPGTFHVFNTIKTIWSIIIWVYLLLHLTFMTVRLNRFPPFTALFVAILIAAIYFCLFNFVLIMLGQGILGVKYYYNGDFLKSL